MGVEADDEDRHGVADADTDVVARVAALERVVTELRETVERQRRDMGSLAAAADIDSVEPVCPECGEGSSSGAPG